MKYCTKCGKELMDEAIICMNCGCAANDAPNANPLPNENDEVSVGLCILAALIPLFGIIYWPLNYKRTPKRAQACGITAIIAWVVNIFIISFAFMGI